MAESPQKILSVRLPESDLRKLEILAQVYGKSVGELIREATIKFLVEIASTEEFRTRAVEFQKTWDEIYGQLVKSRLLSTRKPTARKRRKRE